MLNPPKKHIFLHLRHKILNNIINFILARESFFNTAVTDNMYAIRVVKQEYIFKI